MGIDDSAFSFSDENVKVIGVVMRLPNYIEGVMVTEVGVDGRNATAQLVKMINSSRYKKQLKLIFIDGIALGGFNVVNIGKLAGETGAPVCTVTRDPPDLAEIEAALKGHFEDWEERLSVIKSAGVTEVKLGDDGTSAYIAVANITIEEAAKILRSSIVRGALPECVRVAHLIGTALERGESRGRA